MSEAEEYKKCRDARMKGLGYCGLFATRDTVQEAYEYAMSMVDTLPEEHRVGVLTAIHVLVNTYAIVIAEDKI